MNKDAMIAMLNEQLTQAVDEKKNAETMAKSIKLAIDVLNGNHIRMFKLDDDDSTLALFKRAEFVIMATNEEQHMLWSKYSSDSKDAVKPVKWVSDGGGPMETIGMVMDEPVVLTISTATIDGVYMVLVEPTSMMVDHQLVRKWIDAHFGKEFDGGRRAVLDTSNFHWAIHSIERAREAAAGLKAA